ncbi:hypothetical protein ACPPVO_37765 [Dactylosporangium sp. McL0621]|uniref:hypothetical protein n=1 Tax=Dactylosporangium sp. McL0621 TaxID=3415678 RepID=UPI003CEE3429
MCFHGPIAIDPRRPIDRIYADAAVVGDHNTLHYHVSAADEPAARSAYPHQVSRIAPVRLRDRDAELEALASFCTAPGTDSYIWWRAGAWAGKSALLSWFVLHPPPGTRVVSFFITARFAGQNDRSAFATVILEQLAELLHQPVPTPIGEANRDALVLGLLAEAAAACEREGDRLVLVVDGLDEDNGTIIGADAYSIAAMLPARPSSGLKIIVAGRPNPPIPDDVPLDHPLREPAIVRELAASPHAREIRTEAERELDRLLAGPELEQNVLGLLAAAGGGLSVPDLAGLAGAEVRAVERLLRRVGGRTFLPRVSTWRPDTAADVYVLGHEELQRTALDVLGDERLERCRRAIHVWAEGFRAAGWPESTPEYLVRGYTSLLESTGDLDRLVACAADRVRHDRMLEITGGDTAALAEITAAQDRILGRPAELDLVLMARLARRRDELAERNAKTPIEAPAVWALIGHVGRAEAMAQSIPDPFRQAGALAELIDAVSTIGDGERVVILADWAADAVRSIADHHQQTLALVALITAVTAHAVRGGALVAHTPRIRSLADQAAALAATIPDRAHQEEARTSLAESLAEAGEPDRVKEISAATYDRYLRARSRIALAKAYVVMGLSDKARGELRIAIELGRKLPAPADRARALAYAAAVTAAAGLPMLAGTLLDEALSQAERLLETRERSPALNALIRGAVAVGDDARAEELVYAIPHPERGPALLARVRSRVLAAGPDEQTRALAGAAGGVEGALARALVARALRTAGDLDGAKPLAYDAEALIRAAELAARAVPDPYRDTDVLIRLAKALLTAGSRSAAATVCARAAGLLDAIGEAAEYRLALARTVVALGDHAEAERLTGPLSNAVDRNRVRLDIVAASAAAGDLDRAEAMARTLTGTDRVAACAEVSRAAAATGEFGRARAIAALFPGSLGRDRVLAELVGPLAAAGRYREAADLADSIRTPAEHEAAVDALRTATLQSIAGIAAQGDVVAADELIRAIERPDLRAEARVAVLAAQPAGEDAATVAALLDSIDIGEPRARAAVRFVEVLAGSGDTAGARALAARAEREIAEMPNRPRRAPVYAALAKAIDATGDHSTAVDVASAIVNLQERTDALLAIARSAVEAGDLPRATETLQLAERTTRGMQSPGQRDAALTGIVTLLAAAAAIALTPTEAEHLADRAESLARRVADGTLRAEALARAAAAVVEAAAADSQRSIGMQERAAALSRSSAAPDYVAAVLTEAAREAAAAGRPERALALARTIPGSDRQAAALCRLAMRTGPELGSLFVAWAYRLGHWTIPLEALARVRPSGLDEFADLIGA